LGSDLAAERAQWKRFERIAELARIIELSRGGFSAPAERSGVVFPEVSSSHVRALLASGGDATRLVPLAVLEAIASAGSYR
jgi:nicotinic acid mononucleotide adenylyltransferase